MPPQLQKQLEEQKINFWFNQPAVPHFGGTFEREVKSVKTALRVILKEQSVPEPILQTLLVEVEGILNVKPLGYVSTHVADLDPITPNMLLMGRRDSSLLQTLYDNEDLLGKRGIPRCWQITSRLHSSSITCQAYRVIRSDGKELTVGQVVLVIDS